MIFTSCVNCGADLPDIAQLTADLEAARAENERADSAIREWMQEHETVLRERDTARRDCERLRLALKGLADMVREFAEEADDIIPLEIAEQALAATEPASDPQPEHICAQCDRPWPCAVHGPSDPQTETGRS